MKGAPFPFVLHADLDAFYASVEQTDDPSLQGKPVVVGGSPESRGVVAASSYEARNFGIRSAMPMRTAVRLCPHLVRISPRFDRYRQVSERVMSIFRTVTQTIEPLSLDEAYLDLGEQPSMDQATDIAQRLRVKVKIDTKLAVTIGGGISKTVAKIASQIAKPDGLLLIAPGEEESFLAPLGVEMLSGVGPKTAGLLKSNGISTLGALASADQAWLGKILGRRGLDLKQRATGTHSSPVEPHRETKSVSAETTLARDVAEEARLVEELTRLSESVAARLRKESLRGRTVTLKLRLSDFTTFTRQSTFPVAIDDQQQIFEAAYELLSAELSPGRKFRLIGVSVTNFQRSIQLSLLER